MADDNELALPIVGLVVNIVFVPGVGTMLGGRLREGLMQLVGYFAGAIGVMIILTRGVADGNPPPAMMPLLIFAIALVAVSYLWAIYSMAEEISIRRSAETARRRD